MPESIRVINDPILRKVCEPVDINAVVLQDLDNLLNTMSATMTAEGGIGLAANQIGRSLRIFILKNETSYDVYINPEILSAEEPVMFEGEGCLSIPGTSATTKRFKRVKLTWLDIQGTKREDTFEDMKAFSVQHEIDHLDGKLYVDQLGPVRRDLVLSRHRKFLKRR